MNLKLEAIVAPEGLQDSAQGFNPGNRPPGRRALKGRQIRLIRNRREAPIYIEPAIAHLCADAHYFSEREIVSLLNEYPVSFRLLQSLKNSCLTPF